MKNVPAFGIGVLNLLFGACAEPEYDETTANGAGRSPTGGSSALTGSGSGGVSGAAGGLASGGKGHTSATGGASGSGSAGGSANTGAGGGSSSGGTNTGGFANAGAGGASSGGTGSSGGTNGSGGANNSGGASGSGGTGSGGAGACAGFSDDFEDGNASGWTDSGGDWAIGDDAGNRVYQGGNGNEESWAGPSCADQVVEAKIKVDFAGSSDSYRAGIMARHAGSSSFYAFALGADGKLTLRRSTSLLTSSVTGTCSAVAAGIDGTEWFTLRMEVTGAPGSIHIKTFLNATPVHDCTSTSASSAPASGPGGVLTYGTTTASFDDFTVNGP